MSKKRIYVIVAKTVQNPVEMKYVSTSPRHYVLRPTPETKTIIQPIGRIGAQIGHVTSKMRMNNLLDFFFLSLARKVKKWMASTVDLRIIADEAITTIVLEVPDSYQLEFYHHLMLKAGLKVYSFYDQNPEYGPGTVKTAICTKPIPKSKLVGITDYLNLWS